MPPGPALASQAPGPAPSPPRRLRSPSPPSPVPDPSARPPTLVPRPPPSSARPGVRPAPLLRPMVHSRFLSRTCGSPSPAPKRRSLPHGCCCGGCSPSPGCSIGFTSDETRKRRVRLSDRGGSDCGPPLRPAALPASAPTPRRRRRRRRGPDARPLRCGRLPPADPPQPRAVRLPPAPRRTRNRPRSRRRRRRPLRCQQTSRIPQLIRWAGPAAAVPCNWLAAAPTERGG